jgi:RNA polymerase sigma-70 factor, ECF subfamily
MTATQDLDRFRPRLLGVAYRILGSYADAEDVVQDAYLRWLRSAPKDVSSVEAWLVTAVSRLSIDKFRRAKTERKMSYTGQWLPEPTVDESLQPEHRAEVYDDLSTAFLVILEKLTPLERAAFVLREVFGYDYPHVAETLERNEIACRQLIRRAKEKIRAARPAPTAARADRQDLVKRFIAAIETGDQQALVALFDPDAVFISDGGGKVATAINAILGAKNIAALLAGLVKKFGSGMTIGAGHVNGEPAALLYQGDQLYSVATIYTDGRRILEMYNVVNPDKLAKVASANLHDQIELVSILPKESTGLDD